MLALGARLAERGHAVALQTWKRWEEDVVRAGIEFFAAPEYQVFPTRERPLKPYEAAVLAARETEPQIAAFAPDAVVTDILTVAPALAAELSGVRFATLIPHVFPHGAPGHPAYSIGARLPRTRLGAGLWRGVHSAVVQSGLERGRSEYNDSRARLGLAPLEYVHTGLSRELTLVGTLPQLEYPRNWEPWARIVGPLMWEPPGELVEPPPGSDPVVLIAPSTSQDPEHALLRAALEGLGDAPVRVIATWNGREPTWRASAPPNTVLVPWLSYARSMPACDVVVTHGGHGTVMRALSNGCRLVVCPAAGDMGENAARIDWAGLGVRIPRRFLSARNLRLAVERALADDRIAVNTRAAAAWTAGHDGPTAAAEELERWLTS
jgi:UDP:flavonoid glycosyltransferase YjiC (YdhE family)